MQIKSIRVSKRMLEFILSTEYQKVYAHKSKEKIEGHWLTLYGDNLEPDVGNVFGLWAGGWFSSVDVYLIDIIGAVIDVKN